MELEFTSHDLDFASDIERIIDDFVLFCMLIGNDFLPSKLAGLQGSGTKMPIVCKFFALFEICDAIHHE